MQDAEANGLVASLKHQAEAKMGILHAVYGGFPSHYGVNQIIDCARSWCFYLTSRCYSVHPAPTLVIPLYCFAWNCHLQYSRPLPYFWNQNS